MFFGMVGKYGQRSKQASEGRKHLECKALDLGNLD